MKASKVLLFSFAFCLLGLNSIKAQGFYFGPKGGLTLAFQNWDGYDRNALFTYHGDFLIESLDEEKRGALFASLGYHVRGSAVRSFSGVNGFVVTRGFRFNNLSLMLGAKRKMNFNESFYSYFHLGVRVEYTLSTNFGNLEESNPVLFAFYPIPELVNKINYGISGGAGMEFPISEFVIPFIEFTVSPDLSFQYNQESIALNTNPAPGIPSNIPARQIRNVSLELSVGFKFLRKVVYVD